MNDAATYADQSWAEHVLLMGDDALQVEIEAVRAEYVEHTKTSPAGDLGTIALDVVEHPIQNVLAWVADDPGRAEAALAAEMSRPTPRQTLVPALQDIIDGGTQ